MGGKQTSSPSSPHKSIASPPPPSSSPSVVNNDGANNLFLRIDDGVVAVLVVRRIDGAVVRNDKTDPDLQCAVDCTADESKGGAVAELAARNASTRAMDEKTCCPGGGFPISPKVRLDRRRRGSISSSSSRCYDVLPLLLLWRHEFCGGFVSCWKFLTEKNRCRSPLCVGSTCNVDEKLVTYASPTCRRHSWLSFNKPLNAWDVGEVTNINMTWMFYGASSFNQDLNAWDVSKVSCFQGDSGEVSYSGAWIYGIWNVWGGIQLKSRAKFMGCQQGD